ncbi:hypothetical protein Taro_002069 [Colocasia esculenta]|uniref:Uncharacterized protein n=1 Tax=Colocasia esculenta TaxID=4460 RepID=A0A843TKN4_COLES|nr:hypothetical protein [Colocasia esculenta]
MFPYRAMHFPARTTSPSPSNTPWPPSSPPASTYPAGRAPFGVAFAYSPASQLLPVNLCMVVCIAAPIIVGVYTLYGPLARKVDPDSEEESHRRDSALEEEKRRAAKGLPQRVVVSRPQWVGGIFYCWDDMTVAYLSFFCTFCVFGWNMERLSFGNMYVHIFTFILFIVAPFWIFNVAGLSIDDNGVREFVGIVGILLCFLGLLYGGFWRIQMRKKFKLLSNKFCWGYPNLTDCMQWLFCWSCSLAQEVRTGNFYDVEDGSFYSKQYEGEGSSRLARLHPLPREGREEPVEVMPPFEAHVAISHACMLDPPPVRIACSWFNTPLLISSRRRESDPC